VSGFKDRVLWFIGDFGRVPEDELPTPRPRRTGFFVGMVVIALLLLILVVAFIVIPGIRAQTTRTPAPVAVPSK
jgi:hypothetical protein